MSLAKTELDPDNRSGCRRPRRWHLRSRPLSAAAVAVGFSAGCFSSGCGAPEESLLASSTAPAVVILRMEAETMVREGYDLVSSSIDSAGRHVRLPVGGSAGRLTRAFGGDTGTYDIYVGLYDESDGEATYTLRIGGSTVASWTGNDDRPGVTPSAVTRTRRRVATNRLVQRGQVVELSATRFRAEYARVDYIELVPVASGPGLAARPNNTRCVAPPRPSTGGELELRRYGEGLTFVTPMRLAQPAADPAGDRLYVAQRNGEVWSIPRSATATNSQKRLEFSLTTLVGALPLQAAGEGGLLGMAFHPQFAANGQLFLSYTTTDPAGGAANMRSVVVRVTKNFSTGTWGSYRLILGPFVQPAQNHNGGDLHFGSGSALFASFGDGGGGGDPSGNGQRRSTFFSKILRIDVDRPTGGRAYGIPADNPWPNGEGGFQPEAFAYGFRNPFRFGVDRETGELWVGDVGQNRWEEIDRVVKGGNYGWNVREGAHCYAPATGCATAGLLDPVFEYPHDPNQTSPAATVSGNSVTGGAVYRGSALPAQYRGWYIFGDFGSRTAWALQGTNPARVNAIQTVGGGQQWVAFNTDREGEIYGVALVSGTIFRLTEGTVGGPLRDYPGTLSATGCFGADPKIPSSALIPYDVNSPLWSDAADKERFMAIPNGRKISVRADGDLVLPIGSVLVKTFLIGGRRIETRFLVRHDDGGWEGFTYEWNGAETQANLLATGKTKTIGSQSWYFPSRTDCTRCHTAAAGSTLGLEVGQLNRSVLYAASGTNANQIETWKHLGLFHNLTAPASTLSAYPDPAIAVGSLSARAQSYLAANCSMCHRPNGGAGASAFDARYQTPFAQKRMCNRDPADALGISNAKIFAPGAPGRSLILQRPSRLDTQRMPPLASSLVHIGGTALLEDWIHSVTACP